MATAPSSTQPEPRERRPFPMVTGVAEVTRVEPLTPELARFTLRCGGLRALPVEEPGEIITLLWPAKGEELVLPEEGWRFPPGVADRQHARNYTVRSWVPGSDEVVVDFVLHGDHGRASAWAMRAGPGDRVGYAGSRMHWTSGLDADWVLLVADETGLPALAAIAEELPAGVPAVAIVEVDAPAGQMELRSRADLRVEWVHRRGAPPGTTTLLRDAVAAADLPEGPGRAWGGAEALAMRDVRRHLQNERGLPPAHAQVLGYWKHRTTDDWE